MPASHPQIADDDRGMGDPSRSARTRPLVAYSNMQHGLQRRARPRHRALSRAPARFQRPQQTAQLLVAMVLQPAMAARRSTPLPAPRFHPAMG